MRRLFLAAILAALASGAQAQTELRDLGCAGGKQPSVDRRATMTEVIFFNQSPAPIRTYWLDHQGHGTSAPEFRPGDSYVQQTYLTHPWVVTRSTAKVCMAIYQPEAPSAIVVVH